MNSLVVEIPGAHVLYLYRKHALIHLYVSFAVHIHIEYSCMCTYTCTIFMRAQYSCMLSMHAYAVFTRTRYAYMYDIRTCMFNIHIRCATYTYDVHSLWWSPGVFNARCRRRPVSSTPGIFDARCRRRPVSSTPGVFNARCWLILIYLSFWYALQKQKRLFIWLVARWVLKMHVW